MKILHLITRMDRGGSAINTLITATEQAKSGHQVVLAFGLSLESDMSFDEKEHVQHELTLFEEKGGSIVILPSLMRGVGWHDWLAWRAISKLLSEGFDLLHTHTSKAGFLGRLAASHLPVVHTPHGHIFHGYFNKVKTDVFVMIERYLAKKTDALIALTVAERNDHLALAIGNEKQWHIVPSGVDIQTIRHKVAQLRQQEGHQFQWHTVSVGRLVPIKGMDRLIRAWSVLCKQKPDVILVLIGDGPEREFLGSLVQSLNIEKNVYFAGWTDPVPWLAEAESFALLSHNEGMGRAVVEAMAAGLPSVVSNVCGLAELVDDSVGRVVDADDADAVAKALLSEWPDSTRKAANHRAEGYSITGMVDALSKVYLKVVKCDV
ncbi:MAG: glycosyltransferase [Mariprofundaceae bacterium]